MDVVDCLLSSLTDLYLQLCNMKTLVKLLTHFKKVIKILFFQIAIGLLFVFALVAKAQDQDAITLQNSQVVNPDGSYSYAYRTSNGISAEESGVGGVSAQGSYDFVSSDGVPVSIQYIADENGYRATGDLIPQPPAIPEYILRALEYIRNHPPAF